MVEVATSLLSCKEDKIIETIHELEKAKTNYFHIDVMDGEFVKNNTHDKMLEYCEYLDHVSRTPLDVHLMVKDIKNFIDGYLIFNPNIITFHYEACKNQEEVMETINYVKEKGRRVGIAIKPNTKVEEIEKFLPFIHLILVMTVEPGKGGQTLITSNIYKINKLNQIREAQNLNFDIEADGGINESNSQKLINAGVDILVAGTAILKSKDYKEAITKLK